MVASICSKVCMQLIGRAKRAPHWGVQSRFRVIVYVVGMSCMNEKEAEARPIMGIIF